MEQESFDDLARLLGTTQVRRQVVRSLAGSLLGGALGGVAARLGLAGDAEAKPKHKAKSEHKGTPEAKRKGHGLLQAEGKGKKKRKKPKPHPDASCDPDVVKLCGKCEKVVCIDGDWVCSSNGEKECPDGSCVAANACCGDKYRCGDGTCIDPFSECCPEQKLCAGNCIAQDACCHLDPTPLCGPCERVVCEQGSWACQPRSDVKACPGGSCVPVEACCPDDLPECGSCEYLDCVDENAICRPIIGQCEAGGEWDPQLCRCRYCEEICNSTTHMCQSIGCPDGHHCEAGQCIQICTYPSKPQLCCAEESTAASRCSCAPADAICYAAGVWCIPGQTCCPPDAVRLGICPQACLQAEICQHCEGAYCP